MTALIVFLWIANMLVDTGGQLFFKAAASEHTAGAGGLAHWKRMASRPWHLLPGPVSGRRHQIRKGLSR